MGLRASEAFRATSLFIVALLILVSILWDGAFDLRYWAPLTFLTLALLVALVAAGALAIPARGSLAVSLAAIWGLAAFALLSTVWSDSAADALQGGALTVLYAALFTLAVAAPATWTGRWAIGVTLVVGVLAIGLATELRMLVDGAGAFLAGRLDDPVGYRNATAALFAFAAWPLIGYAARRGFGAGFRAGAFAGTILVLGLAFLTQSRGVLLGFACGAVVSLAIGPDRLRRSWVAIAVLVLLALGSGPLLTAYDASGSGAMAASGADVRDAAVALLLISCAAFLGALLAFVFDNGVRSADVAQPVRSVAIVGLAIIAGLAVSVALVKAGNPVDYVDRKVSEFTETEQTAQAGSTRLGSVSGQRYDLWRVALDQFSDQPLAGAGEGSYRFAYYRERRTDRNLDDAHSLPLRLLAETGLIGFGLFAVWLGALGVTIYRRACDASPGARLWVAGMAAAGTTVLAQSTVDWLWLIPALFGLGVLALGLAARGEDDEMDVALGPEAPAVRIAVALGLAALAVGVGALFLSGVYVRKARQQALVSPRAALSAARSAESLNPVALPPLYLQASALETLGNRAAARRALHDALEREPGNFTTLGVLGDLETRAGNEVLARDFYRRALALNPRDVGLRELSAGSGN